MKRGFYLVLTVAMMCLAWACSDSDDDKDDDKQIIVPDEKELTQTAYADEEDTGGGFTFTAKSAWTASVNETTPVKSTEINNVVWLKLLNGEKEIYSGEAGSFSLTISLVPNYTGQKRTATIEIICGTDKITIVVEQDSKTEVGEVPKDPNPVSYIEINKEFLTLMVGETETLQASVYPENATVKEIRWSSSDPTVATVDALTGEVKAVGEGVATIRVRSSAYPDIYIGCKITVVGETGKEESDGELSLNGETYKVVLGVADYGDHYRDGLLNTRFYINNLQPVIYGGDSISVEIQLSYAKGNEFVPTGTYTFSSNRQEGIFSAIDELRIGNTYYSVTGGGISVETVKIDEDMADFKISMNLQTSVGVVTCSFDGIYEFIYPTSLFYTTYDPILDQWITEKYITPGYNYISWVEAPNVSEIDLPYTSGTKVGERTGGEISLRLFPNIQKVNLRGQAVRQIEFYNDDKNGQLRRLDIANNQLGATLNVAYQVDLEYLDCSGNPNLGTINIARSQYNRIQQGTLTIIKDGTAEFKISVED